LQDSSDSQTLSSSAVGAASAPCRAFSHVSGHKVCSYAVSDTSAASPFRL
jgi:hypothetical protein